MKQTYKKYRKYIVLALLLIALVGCTQVYDPVTKQIKEEMIIHLNDPFPWGREGFGWFATFIVWPISQAFNFVAHYTGSAFLAITIVTILLNLLTFTLTAKQTVQQQKMQILQPEMNRVTEKYRGRTDEQAKMQQAAEMQKLYQKHEINPLGSFLPLIIQFPIIIAMYQAVQRAELIIEGSFLGQTLKATPQEGFQTGNVVYIGLFVIMVITQALSMFLPQYLLKRKQRKRKYDKKPEGPNQNTMMFVSLAMISYFGLTWNVGMSMYWAVSSVVRLLQTLFIQWKYVDNAKK